MGIWGRCGLRRLRWRRCRRLGWGRWRGNRMMFMNLMLNSLVALFL